MNVLVIGGTGFIGRHVTQRLASRDVELFVFHRGDTTTDLPDGVTEVFGSRNDPDSIRDAIEEATPDVVLDVIPYTDAQAQALVSVCTGATGRLVILSSGDVYRQYDGLRGVSDAAPDPIPLGEEAPLRTSRFPYRGADTDFPYAEDYDKILVEERVRTSDVPSTILRLPKVYGPGDHEHHVGDALAQLRNAGDELVLSESRARWRWSRGYVSNVAAAVAEAAVNPIATNRTYNLGEPDALPEATWLQKLADVAGISTTIRTVPDDEVGQEPPLRWRYSLALDTRRIRTELSFSEEISHQQAMVRSVVWEREHEG